MQNSRIILTAAMVVGAWISWPAGCVNVNVDADSYVRRYAGPYIGIQAEDAAAIARRRAKDEKINIEKYTLTTRSSDGGWWIMFDQIDGENKPRRWPVHFTIHVDSKGNATLYKDR